MGKRSAKRESQRDREMLATDLDLMLPRIGREPWERLKWVVKLVQRDPHAMTSADRENLSLELSAFAYVGNPLSDSWLQFIRSSGFPMRKLPLQPVPERELKKVLDRLRTNIGRVVRRECHYPTSASGREWRVWNEDSQRWVAWLSEDLSYVDHVAVALDRLVGEYGHLVRACPAPAKRAKAGETCGRWFVGKRLDQEYCDGTCQSRASTRAARGNTKTPASLKRRHQVA